MKCLQKACKCGPDPCSSQPCSLHLALLRGAAPCGKAEHVSQEDFQGAVSNSEVYTAVAAAPAAAVNSNTASPAVKFLSEPDFTNALQLLLAIHLISAGITFQDPSPFI